MVLIFLLLFLILFLSTKLDFRKETKSKDKGNFSPPIHPEMEDCMQVEDKFEKRFCIADVAEIKENVTICQKIGDFKRIKKFCKARITLNKTMCRELQDKKLERSCLESIRLKEKWGNESKTNK